MLRTNLSTRPFYNIRTVQAALGACAALVILMTMFNVVRVLQLNDAQRQYGSRATQALADAKRFRADAEDVRKQVDAKDLEVVSSAAREANAIIDLRAFSWSDLLAQFEKTLPENVRITAIQPRLEQDGRFIVGIRVEARQIGDLEAFLEALETTGAFRNVLATDEQATSDGLLEAVIEGLYVQPASDAGVEKPLAAAARAEGAGGD
jgi:Tfp pilus assembly protein PilN